MFVHKRAWQKVEGASGLCNVEAQPKTRRREGNGSPAAAYAPQEDRCLAGTHDTVTVHRDTSQEDFLKNIERQPSNRRNEGHMGVDMSSESAVFFCQFLEGNLQIGDFIGKGLQAKDRLSNIG